MGKQFWETQEFFKGLDLTHSHDALTSLFDRETIFEYIDYLVSNKQLFSMFIVDLDNFKYVNDNYGHVAGDKVLKKTSLILSECVNSNGVVGRFGGDEFIVVIPNIVDYDQIWQICRHINLSISGTPIKEMNNNNVTTTIGCSRFSQDGSTVKAIFDKADKALYRGKQKGRNCFIIYLKEKHANIVRNSAEAAAFNSMDLHIKVEKMLTSSNSLKDNIKELMMFLSTNLMFDHICIQSQEYIKDEVIHPLSYNKYFHTIDNTVLETNTSANGICCVNNVKTLAAKDNEDMLFALEEQRITGIICVRIETFGKPFGYVRVDATTPDGRIWQTSDIDIIIVFAEILGLILYYNNTNLDEIYTDDHVVVMNNYNKIRNEHNNFMRTANSHVIANNENVVFLAFDLSNFKYINDFYGLDEGDSVIDAISNFFFKNDKYCVAAYSMGFDQFQGMFQYTGMTKDEFIDYISKKANEFEIMLDTRYPLVYNHVYLGLYFYDDSDVDVRLATDKASLAKKSIKGNYNIRYAIYEDTSVTKEFSKMDAVNLFMSALEKTQIKLFIQPKVSASTLEVKGGEALVRIVTENNEVISPGKFIPVLEDTGLIGVLDSTMIEKVFQFQRGCLDKGLNTYTVSVNVSRQFFCKPEFCDLIFELQEKYNVPPKLVEFEILESTFVNNMAGIIDSIKKLRGAGFGISVDDFGAGYSSLNQIANIPADCIKIDRLFARDSLKTEKGRDVIKYLINMLNAINYDIVFEGVETKEQLDLVTSYGCDKIQGFYFSPAIIDTEFMKNFGKSRKFEKN